MEEIQSSAKDTLLMWLERDLEHNKFPTEFSRECREDLKEEEYSVIRLKYDDGSFIDFPYNSDIYNSAWEFFNHYWQSGKLSSSGKLICH